MDRPFKTLSKTLVYQNPWLKVYEHKIKRRDREGVYAVVERENTVIVIPLSPSLRTVLLRQYRYPTDSDSWELPMGGVGSAERKEDAVKRELLEETGLDAAEYELIGEYHAVPGLTPQQVSVFVVRMSEEQMDASFTPEGMDEIQQVRIRSLSSVYDMVRQGQITDGFTLVGLLYLRLHLDSLPR